MELTKFSDYSVRLLIYLALHRHRLVSISEVAEAYGISRNHLIKIVTNLSQLDLIQTVRGKGGGLRLAKEPEEINLGILLRQTETRLNLLECFNPSTNTCRIAPCCGLTGIMKQAFSVFFAELDKHTLAGILDNKSRLTALLATRGQNSNTAASSPTEPGVDD